MQNFLTGGGLNPFTIFKEFDMNNDNKITEDDFVLAMDKFGLSFLGDEMARQAFKSLDKNGNGKLDITEAINAFTKLTKLASQFQGQFGQGGHASAQ